MNLPEPKIDRKYAMELWNLEHSDYAKEQVILNNVGLVGEALRSLNLNRFDEDLFATGVAGLVKAVNSFDADKGVEFSTYATTVARNEIIKSLRKKRITPQFSLDELYSLDNGDEVYYADMITNGKDFEEELISDMHFKRLMETLAEGEKQVILARMKGKSQNQIADMLGISQAQVSRIIKKVYEKYKE